MGKNCQQCGREFEHLESEKSLLDRLSLPFPTWCSECRNQRRMMFRNDRVFYHRKCDLSGKQFISMYQLDAPYKIYQPAEWYSDKWNPMDYGRDFDFERPFFEQFNDLMHDVPRLGIDIVNCENSDYCNYCGDDKNCYLDIAGEANEDCYYNLFVKSSKDVVDCTFAYTCTLCYECINCYDCYNCQNCIYCDNCSDCFYCFDLIGCKNCLFSHGLRNKEYCIFNEQKTKEEYDEYLNSLKMGSHSQRKKLAEGWQKFCLENAVYRANYHLNCENCSGNNLKNCKNTFESFNATNCEDSAYLYDVLDAKDCMDMNYSLYNPEFSYEIISTLSMNKCAFSMASHYNSDIFYCDLINNSSNLFGCIALNHGEYCILNKQYSKEEYEKMVPKIIEHMKSTGEWGQFFPVELSPFAYNETVANEYFPMSKEDVQAKGWRWKDSDTEKMYKGPRAELPDDIADASLDLTKEILQCEQSEKLFKLIPQELNFYKRQNIPIPRCAPNQRHLDRMDLRNPRRLFENKCSQCSNDLKTSYGPGRPEKILCDSCYRAALY